MLVKLACVLIPDSAVGSSWSLSHFEPYFGLLRSKTHPLAKVHDGFRKHLSEPRSSSDKCAASPSFFFVFVLFLHHTKVAS